MEELTEDDIAASGYDSTDDWLNAVRDTRPETQLGDYVTIARFEYNAKEMQNA